MLLDMESTGFCLGALERETTHVLVDMELVRDRVFKKGQLWKRMDLASSSTREVDRHEV